MTRTRQNKVTVFLDDAEFEMLEALVERTGLSKSDVIRQLVRREHAGAAPNPKPTKAKPRPR